MHAWVHSHQPEIVRQFAELLAIPNVASDTANIRKNAAYISSQLQKRGVQSRLLEDIDGPPIVYGELPAPGARHTIIVYAHYDGQHVDGKQWATPPWTPTVRAGALEENARTVALDALPREIPGEWRIYARSAGDDKTPIEAVLAALDALQATGAKRTVNLKFFFEGEEEAGSPHLATTMERYADLLQSDAWLICDGPVHPTRRPQLYFGARGVVDVEMTLYGPSHAMHSGHYGNWAPNPAVLMAELIASMRDSNGHIRIPGYYDDVKPLTESEKQAIAAMPDVDTKLKRELQLAWTEGQPEPLALRIMQPALNVRGLQSGHVGAEAQNAVPTEARASIDFRLVPGQQPERIRQMVEQHIARQGFYVVHQAPTNADRLAHAKIMFLDWGPGYPSARTSMDLPVSRALVSAIEGALHQPVIRAPMLGGSVPMYLFLKFAPAIGLPVANHDDNQHAQNENLRIQNLYDAIDIFAAVMTGMDAKWK